MIDTYKRLRYNPLEVAGIVLENKTVALSGFFTLVDGQGILLDVVLHYFNDNGFTPCWLSFFKETLKKGWNPRSTLSKIESACADVYGFEHATVVVERLKCLTTPN